MPMALSTQGEHGPKGIHIEGSPPELFVAIREEMAQAQSAAGGEKANVDYIFEVPLRTAQRLVGFKHDEICRHTIDQHYVVLSRLPQNSHGIMRIVRCGRTLPSCILVSIR